jgi:hypothetical protein
MRWGILAVVSFLIAGHASAQNMIQSTFDTDTDGWSTYNDATNFRHIATGGNPGGHIAATDQASGAIYYFVAPSKFLGDRTRSYASTLSYDVKTSAAVSAGGDDIVLISGGITIRLRFPTGPGTSWTHYSTTLSEDAGWINTATGVAPTPEVFLQVMANITTLRIRGEYVSGGDIGYLDNVAMGVSNDAPTANDDVAELPEDSPAITVGVLGNDSDPDGDSIFLVEAFQSSHGTVVVNGDSVQYTPDPDFFGADSVTYIVSDGAGASDTGTLYINVTPVDDPPRSFSILGPQAGAIVGRGLVDFSWTSSEDVDGDGLLYTLTLQTDGIDTNFVATDTTITVDFADFELLPVRTTVFWNVSVTDGNGEIFSGTFSIEVMAPILYGDPSDDGFISTFDAAIVLQSITGLATLTDSQAVAADVTGNGSVSAWDASHILGYVVRVINEFPVNSDGVPNMKQSSGSISNVVWGTPEHVGGDLYRIPLIVSDATNIRAADIAIETDAELLDISYLPGSANQGWLVSESVTDRTVTLALAGRTELQGTELLSIIVKTNSAVGAIELMGTYRLTENGALQNLGSIHIGSQPEEFTLNQNAPNPFNPTTTISYALPYAGHVRLSIWTATGQLVREIMNAELGAGRHTTTWDGMDTAGRSAASGVYLYRLLYTGCR